MKNKVFIATSMDGFIAEKDGGIDWLHAIPNPAGDDMGYGAFMSQIDALVMGRNTFETVCGFDIEWPYKKPVFVLSSSMQAIPEKFRDKASLVKGSLTEVLDQIQRKGYRDLYIDGGKTIQSFLKEDLIAELTVTVIPILLGEGIPLFGELPHRLRFECVESKIYLQQIVQNKFVRKRLEEKL